VLSSVHAFATDPKRGLFILAFLAVVVGGSLTLYAWRAPKIGLGARFGSFSRESLLLTNNVILVAAMASVLLGTLYPLALDALGMGKISVGPPYFDTVFVPLMLPLLILTGFGPMVRWKEASVGEVMRSLRVAAAVALIAGLGVAAATGKLLTMTAVGLVVFFWIVAAVATDLWQWIRPSATTGKPWQRLRQLPRATAGMMLAHLGVAAFVLGVTAVRSYEIERDVRMAPGDTAELAGYTFRMEGLRDIKGPNYDAVRGSVAVERNGKLVTRMSPEKRVYRVQTNPMTEAAISPGLLGDLYVSLGEPVSETGVTGAWGVRIYIKPFVDWIWLGAFLMALGGFIAIADRRYRIVVARRTAPAGAAAA
jgi:cytochrome c-type biogenesis protein CcmF